MNSQVRGHILEIIDQTPRNIRPNFDPILFYCTKDFGQVPSKILLTIFVVDNFFKREFVLAVNLVTISLRDGYWVYARHTPGTLAL